MRTALVFTVLALMALLLQTTLLPRVAIGRATPDLLLILTVYLGLHYHSASGAAGAFVLGYLQDLSSASGAGMNAFAACMVYLLVYLTSRRLWVDNAISKVVVVFLASVVKALVILAVALVFVSPSGLGRPPLTTLFLQGALAAILSPLVFAILTQALQPPVEEEE